MRLTKDGEPVGLVFRRMSPITFGIWVVVLTGVVAWGIADVVIGGGSDRVFSAVGASITVAVLMLLIWSRVRTIR